MSKINKEQILHDLSLAYILYTNLSDTPMDAESFYQEYERATNDLKKIVDHYNS